jgi:hypothetical protein
MAGPITWRTVAGMSPAEAARPLAYATQTLNSGFDFLDKALTDRRTANQAVVDRGRDTDLVAFREALAGATTPEQVAALQQSGQLDALRARLDPARRGQLVGAEDARVSAARQNLLASQTYDDAQLDRAQAPVKDSILSLVAQNRSGDALAALQANPGLRNAAQVYQAITNGERDFTRFGWEAATQKRQGEAHSDTLLTNAVQRRVSQQNASTNAGQLDIARQDAQERKALREKMDRATQAAAEQEWLRKNNLYGEGIYTPQHTGDLMKLMKDNDIGDDVGERQAIIARLNKLGDQEVQTRDDKGNLVKAKVPIPLSAVKASILGSKDQMANLWNQGYANTMENQLKDMLKQHQPVMGPDGTPIMVNPYVEDFARWTKTQTKAVDNPMPQPVKRR